VLFLTALMLLCYTAIEFIFVSAYATLIVRCYFRKHYAGFHLNSPERERWQVRKQCALGMHVGTCGLLLLQRPRRSRWRRWRRQTWDPQRCSPTNRPGRPEGRESSDSEAEISALPAPL